MRKQATGVTLGYQGTEALTDVSFAVAAGDYVGIVGPNGSGKSTLIRCILGLARPDRGEIRLFGTPLAVFDQWQRVGYLPQGLQYFNPHFPASLAEVVGGGRWPRTPLCYPAPINLRSGW